MTWRKARFEFLSGKEKDLREGARLTGQRGKGAPPD